MSYMEIDSEPAAFGGVLAGPTSAVEKVITYCNGVMGCAIIDYSD